MYSSSEFAGDQDAEMKLSSHNAHVPLSVCFIAESMSGDCSLKQEMAVPAGTAGEIVPGRISSPYSTK